MYRYTRFPVILTKIKNTIGCVQFSKNKKNRMSDISLKNYSLKSENEDVSKALLSYFDWFDSRVNERNKKIRVVFEDAIFKNK